MRHPAFFMVVGFALGLLPSVGCVSKVALRSIYQTVSDAQGKALQGLDALDAECQAAQRDAAGLQRCRAGRDLVRQALRDELNELQAVSK
jgi:hypothetical protein